MTIPTSLPAGVDPHSLTDDFAVQILSDEGAQCGDCGDQPGDRICPDCEKCRHRYVLALRAAGWGPTGAFIAEVQRLAGELAERTEELAFLHRSTLPDLRTSVDYHMAGKERWRNRALEAEALVRNLQRPAIESQRDEARSAMTALAAEAERERDFEGAAAISQELAKYEAKWLREDEEAAS